jgi:hypothetical protein
MDFERLGGKLTEKHTRTMMITERKLCNCRKEMSENEIRSSYPPCVSQWGRENISDDDHLEIIYTFWEVLIKEVQKKHADWVMEAYLLDT